MIYNGALPGHRVWLIADTHFGHGNIIRYCNRPFQTVKEMDREMILRWNSVVGGQDVVIVAGDFAMGRRAKQWRKYAARIHGDLMMVDGNHDHIPAAFEAMKIRYEEEDFLILHNPAMIPEDWEGWVIHGHVHNHNPAQYPLISWESRTINISAEMINYTPVPFQTLADLAIGQDWKGITVGPLPTDAGEADYIPPGGQ